MPLRWWALSNSNILWSFFSLLARFINEHSKFYGCAEDDRWERPWYVVEWKLFDALCSHSTFFPLLDCTQIDCAWGDMKSWQIEWNFYDLKYDSVPGRSRVKGEEARRLTISITCSSDIVAVHKRWMLLADHHAMLSRQNWDFHSMIG